MFQGESRSVRWDPKLRVLQLCRTPQTTQTQARSFFTLSNLNLIELPSRNFLIQGPSERDEAANGRIFPVWSHLAPTELFAQLWPQKIKDNIQTVSGCLSSNVFEINKFQILEASKCVTQLH